jgi:hypothetical protein
MAAFTVRVSAQESHEQGARAPPGAATTAVRQVTPAQRDPPEGLDSSCSYPVFILYSSCSPRPFFLV